MRIIKLNLKGGNTNLINTKTKDYIPIYFTFLDGYLNEDYGSKYLDNLFFLSDIGMINDSIIHYKIFEIPLNKDTLIIIFDDYLNLHELFIDFFKEEDEFKLDIKKKIDVVYNQIKFRFLYH